LRIFKYPINIGKTDIGLPVGSYVLSVQMQNGQPCVWVMLDPDDENKTVATFEVVGTGHDIDRTDKGFVGTFQDGAFVWHLFVGIYK